MSRVALRMCLLAGSLASLVACAGHVDATSRRPHVTVLECFGPEPSPTPEVVVHRVRGFEIPASIDKPPSPAEVRLRIAQRRAERALRSAARR
jgi:hypothetical protein